MRVVAIVQARLGSTRLPSKVLMDIGGRPMLQLVTERARAARRVDEVVVATTVAASDDAIEALCRADGLRCVRGSEKDVLDRYHEAARAAAADVVVRITADCPLLDPRVIDDVIHELERSGLDYASNIDPPTFPDGLDVEAFTRAALDRAWAEARMPSEREHVTPYIRSHPDRFRMGVVKAPRDLSAMRWTVDEASDLALVRGIVSALGSAPRPYTEIVAFIEANPNVARINEGIARNEGYLASLRQDQEEKTMTSGTGQRLYQRARKQIPGGTQLLSKRPEMFLPESWPAYFSRARGATVWDLDGRAFVDMSYNGIGANILGAADPDVDRAVKDAIDKGVSSTLNAPEEVELADLLFEIHPWAGGVRYARSGGEAMAVAVRIARAHARRDKIAFCGYHGWHDWYLSANLAAEHALDGHLLPGLSPVGVPRGLQGTALPFQYNRLDELEAIVERERGELAAIVMEPVRSYQPDPAFLQGVRKIADRIGAVLIYDEVTSGFRVNSGGAHLTLGVRPDIAVFAKAMANGYAMAAVLGRSEVMDAAQSTFISSTNWTERIGPVAALATIRKHRATNAGEHLVRIGKRVKDGWARASRATGVPMHVSGLDPLGHFELDVQDARAARTLLTKLLLERGYLATSSFYATLAHDDAIVDRYLEEFEGALQVVGKAVSGGTVRDQLGGGVAHEGFRRLA